MKSFRLTALLTLLWGTPGWSSDIENYFASEPFRCGISLVTAQLAVVSQPDDSVSIQYYTSQYGFPRFGGQKFKFSPEELGSTVDMTNGNWKARLSGALTDKPEFVALNFQGKVATDCQPVLFKTDSPLKRLDTVSEFLKKQQPLPIDAIAVNKLYPNLAPVELMPAFKEGTSQQEIEKRKKDFWMRYEENTIQSASDLANSEIMPGLEETWLAQTRSKRKWHGELLIKAQRARAFSLIAAGKASDKSSLRPVDICKRIDGFTEAWNAASYVELASGMPFSMWTQQDFNEQLTAANACEKSDVFEKNLNRYWQQFEKNLAAVDKLREKQQSLLDTPVEPKTLADNMWFDRDEQVVKDAFAARVNRQLIKAFYEDTIEKKQQKILETIPKALALQAADDNVALDKLSNYCRRELEFSGANADLHTATLNECNSLVSDLFLSRSLEEIENGKEKWLAMPSDKNTLLNFSGVYVVANHQFDSVDSKLNSALRDANNKVHVHLSGVVKNISLEIKQAYQDVNFQSGAKDKLDMLCEEISAAKKFGGVKTLDSQCNNYNQKFGTQVFFIKSIDKIQSEKEKWLAMPASRETLYKKRDKGITLAVPSAFRSVTGDISTALADANNEIDEHLSGVFEDTVKDMEQAYQEIDFQSGTKDKLDKLCGEVSAVPVKNQSVRALDAECQAYNKKFENEYANFSCSSQWNELELSKELDSVELPTPGGPLLSLRKMYCRFNENGDKITFSSEQVDSLPEYTISRVEIIENTPVKFSVRLNAPPSAEHNWYLGGGKMEPNMFDAERFISHNDLLACLISPQQCVR